MNDLAIVGVGVGLLWVIVSLLWKRLGAVDTSTKAHQRDVDASLGKFASDNYKLRERIKSLERANLFDDDDTDGFNVLDAGIPESGKHFKLTSTQGCYARSVEAIMASETDEDING